MSGSTDPENPAPPKKTFTPPKRQPPQKPATEKSAAEQPKPSKSFSQWCSEDADDDFD
jgi:hypothetical protein